ncbi:MAG: thioredoxin [Ilumatobacter coccineus]|uniref:Thioredoxin n=1 Tax=Ilumatobacter coccineus TaxID=467094 RepID=A0A2G6K730_9ACTN|nr:MAG: thioredoxin [Ilumatobacter coccineus]
MPVSHLTSSTFDDTIANPSAPVLVDFWAEWCTPCKKIAPILEELANELGDQIVIAKIDIDDHPDIAMRYQIMSVPTLAVFQGGELRKKMVGAKGKSALLSDLAEFL